MAKRETRLRTAIKKALEADGFSVVTQHGSAYQPNIPDLLVVLAALEVKTEDGELRPGQRNRIRRFRQDGIPAGIVRSVEEARQGMRLVKQGTYRMIDNPQAPVVDMSFLQGILAQSAPEPEPAPAAAPIEAVVPQSEAEIEHPVTLDNLLGMQLTNVETFEPQPAPEEPETAPTPTARPMVEAYQSVLKQAEQTQTIEQEAARVLTPQNIAALGAVGTPAYLSPHPQMGVLEQIVMHLRHIDETLSSLVAGFGQGTVPAPQSEQPVRRRRRTKAEMEAAAAAGEAPEAVE